MTWLRKQIVAQIRRLKILFPNCSQTIIDKKETKKGVRHFYVRFPYITNVVTPTTKTGAIMTPISSARPCAWRLAHSQRRAPCPIQNPQPAIHSSWWRVHETQVTVQKTYNDKARHMKDQYFPRRNENRKTDRQIHTCTHTHTNIHSHHATDTQTMTTDTQTIPTHTHTHSNRDCKHSNHDRKHSNHDHMIPFTQSVTADTQIIITFTRTITTNT